MPTPVAVSSSALGRYQALRIARNRLVAPASAAAQLAQQCNQLVRHRGKELFVSPGSIAQIAASAGAGTNTLWRSYIHLGPFTQIVKWRMSMVRPSSGSTGAPAATIEIQDSGGTLVESATRSFGYGTLSDITSAWQTFAGSFGLTTPLTPDTDYRLEFKVIDNGRIANAVVVEDAAPLLTSNGFIADGVVNGSPILNDVMTSAQNVLYQTYRRGAAVVLDWHGNRSRGSATDINVIDNSSTTVSATTPGFTLDMKYKAKLSATSVNCKFFVWGNVDAGTGGNVKIKDSGGSTLATVTGFTTTPGWHSTTLALPATLAKYDLTISTGGAQVNIRQIAIFEHET